MIVSQMLLKPFLALPVVGINLTVEKALKRVKLSHTVYKGNIDREESVVLIAGGSESLL